MVERKLGELAYYNNSGFSIVAQALKELNEIAKEKTLL